MKKMIRNSLSEFQRSLFISLTLILISITPGTSQPSPDVMNYPGDLMFYTRENSREELSADTIYFAIIKNNKSCLNCFQTLTSYLKELHLQKEFNLLAVSFSDSNSLSRKRNVYESMNLFPGFQRYVVIYDQEWNEKTTTPELLVIKNKSIYRFRYEELFANGFEFISGEVQQKINAILKNE